ncbi:MAG TPA: type II secretion system F family protein [Bryobacteraceae bacterium]|nr:type II secretion system F family protein [Bryobacteraceae bacterium]
MFVLVAFVIFTGALLAAAYYAWSVPQQQESDAISNRLRELRARTGAPRKTTSADLLRTENRGTFAFMGDFRGWFRVLGRLQEMIDQANLKYRAVDIMVVSLILFVATYLVTGLFGLDLMMLQLVLGVVVATIPVAVVMRIRRSRLDKLQEMFPDAIDLFTRSMKAGHTIHSGLETIANETSDPVKMEFKKVVEELALGSPIEDALHNLGARVPLIDLKFFITGLILQRQTGANLTEVLDNLSLLVRERLNMNAKMKAHTAQQRMSAALLCALPIVVAIGFWIVKPDFIQILYTDDTGKIFLTYGVISEIVGILVIRKIANPKF